MKSIQTLPLLAFGCITAVYAIPQMLESPRLTWSIGPQLLEGHTLSVRFFNHNNGWFFRTINLDLDQCFGVDATKKELIAQDKGKALTKCKEEQKDCTLQKNNETGSSALDCDCASVRGKVELDTFLTFNANTGDVECYKHKGVDYLMERLKSKSGTADKE
ncbi:hypothetical protein BDV26DRAFT_290951 [Aspergillus bertholletiae]|uniref:Uncharacterized protein n=1 Tax=Aspergillus bertholletiae TaxID=1226010 RepID=A0A5N7BDH9_9EURO|nr:hypothetical protein BDV26DRAFT_290951 [Aspergillus bertholletiae]